MKNSCIGIFGTWEQIYNPAFKMVELDHFKSEASLHTIERPSELGELSYSSRR